MTDGFIIIQNLDLQIHHLDYLYLMSPYRLIQKTGLLKSDSNNIAFEYLSNFQ